MSVRYSKNRYVVDYYPAGRKGRRVMFRLPPGTTQQQANEIERELRSYKDHSQSTIQSGNISKMIEHYLEHCVLHQSPETVRDKRSHYKTHIVPYFGSLYIHDLTNSMITVYKQKMKEKLYKGKPLNNHTISKGLNYFSAFLKWAEEEMHVVPLQPLRIRRLPYTRPVPTVLSINEVMAFIEAADKPYDTMFKIFFYLGLRNRAVRRLQWSDLDWEKCAIKTTEKGGKVKWHPLPEDLLDELRQMYIHGKSPWIFPSPRNLQQPINKLHTIIQAARQKAGITKRIHAHLLRHSIATYLLERDVDIRQIQAFLGHSQISTTEWYAQVSLEQRRQAMKKAGFRM